MTTKNGNPRSTDINGKAYRTLPVAVVHRLLKYHDYLQELNARKDCKHVSSSELAEYVRCESSLVRRDLASIGAMGQAKVGFPVQHVLDRVQSALGCDGVPTAVLFGVGRFGNFLLRHDWHRQAGVVLSVAFDTDPLKVGKEIGGVPVMALADAPDAIQETGASIAILAVHSSVAQSCADVSISAGVKAIWNFAPCVLDLPASIVVRNENLASGLKELRCLMFYEMREHRSPSAEPNKATTPTGCGGQYPA